MQKKMSWYLRDTSDRKKTSWIRSTRPSISPDVSFGVWKMEILRTLKFHLRALGCMPLELPFSFPFWCRKLPIAEIHIGLMFALLFQNLCSTVWFWLYEAKDFKERSQSGFFCSRSFLSLILYARLVYKRTELIKLITQLEDIVAKSKRIFRFFSQI